MRYTIKDIAKEAKVSVSTVSKCLNGYSDIGPETKKLVFETIEKMDYVPNTYAQYVSNHSTRIIGLTVPDVKDPYSAQCTYGIEDGLKKFGYDLFIGNMDRNEDRFISFINTARKMRFDGLILTPEVWTDKVYNAVKRLDVPVLSIRRRPPQTFNVRYIDSDHFSGAIDVLNYLYKNGHRKIAHVSLPNEAGLLREQAYRKFCEDNNLEQIVESENGSASILSEAVSYGRLCCRKLLHKFSDVTAIFCGSDFIAIGVMAELRDMGKKIPDDISIISIGNAEYSELPWFNLTTLELHRYEMGLKAAELLVNSIEGHQTTDTLFKTTLVERNSVLNIN